MDHRVLLFLIFIPCSVITDKVFFRGKTLTRGVSYGRGVQWNGSKNADSVHASETHEITEQWFDQRLDHFNPADTRSWKQRFFVEDKFYESGGPVLIQLGGEGAADPVWLKEGQIATNYGKDMKAMLILIEHRYYGESHPTADLSTSNLRYLTSEQALADFAAFITDFKARHPQVSSAAWMSFGGSYSGSLSAWMRLKYPHLIDAAVASSAPLLALINFTDYLQVVRTSLGQTCSSAIGRSTEQITKLLHDSHDGWEELTKSFMLCDPLDGSSEEDVGNFVQSLASNFEGVVQYNKDNRDFEKAKATNITIDVVCDVMENENIGTEMERYAEVNRILLQAYGQKCLDHSYSKLIKDLKSVSWNSSAAGGGRQWTYQTCTEFGFFQSSDLRDQPFGHFFPVSFFEKMCTDVYGADFTHDLLEQGVNFTNTFYGAHGIKGTRIVFPNGSIDPWHALGVIKQDQVSSDSLVLFIKETAHCADLYPDTDNDPQQLREARNQISAFLKAVVADKAAPRQKSYFYHLIDIFSVSPAA